MTAKFFVDTNVLIYAASTAAADEHRRETALRLLERPDAVLSAQVLAEFYSVARSKTKLNLTHDDAMLLLQAVARIPTCSITRDLVIEATEISRRYQISYWDASIIAAAQRMGCSVLYSEDLNAGQKFDGVEVRNPFASLPT